MARARFSILRFVGAIGIALGLWTYVALIRSYEDDLSMPLIVVSPPNQALLSAVPATISVRVRATGLQLLNAKYFMKSSSCTLDLRRMRSADGSKYLVESADLLRGVVSTLPLRTIAVVPNTLQLSTGDLHTKRVPLRVRSSITCRDGFVVVRTPTADVPEVEVRGTKGIVDAITEWHTQRVGMDDAHESIALDVAVSDTLAALVNVIPPTVRVSVNVQQVADRVVTDVPLVVISNVGGQAVAAPALVSVTVRGGVEDVSRVTRDNITAEVMDNNIAGISRPRITVNAPVTVVAVTPSVVRVRELRVQPR